GNAYVTGRTYSTDFPTVNAYDTTGDGSTSYPDVFVCKLAADGSSLLYSTYVSGNNNEEGYGIAIDSTGNAYVTGHTSSTDFPTVNAYDTTGDGSTSHQDVFVCKLAANGSSLLYSTYVSGSDDDLGYDIAVDSTGNAYVTGRTYSTDFPTVNPYNASGDGSTSYQDVFVCKLISYSPPKPPRELTVAISADSKVILIWGEPMDDGNAPITAYRVYRSTTSGVYGSFLAEATSEAFIDSTAVSGVDYFYVVTAVNSVGESALSNEATITILTAPTAPQSLLATPGDNFVYLSWSTPSSDGGSTIIRYRVYRGTSSGNYFFLGVATSTNFNDTTALGGTTYYYVVTAVNAVGESGFSNEVSTTAAGSPPGPVTTTVTTTLTTIVTSFTISSETIPTASPGFEVLGLVIALTSLVIAAVIYRRRKNA
ncbi:MAG: fibronectin type III domain-containing protein, partial [Candidatus Hermodarchaeota archaeon]